MIGHVLKLLVYLHSSCFKHQNFLVMSSFYWRLPTHKLFLLFILNFLHFNLLRQTAQYKGKNSHYPWAFTTRKFPRAGSLLRRTQFTLRFELQEQTTKQKTLSWFSQTPAALYGKGVKRKESLESINNLKNTFCKPITMAEVTGF